MRREVSCEEHEMAKIWQRRVMDAVIDLNRIDQRLADIAAWIALPDSDLSKQVGVPETLAEHMVSGIRTLRAEELGDVLCLLRTVADKTHLSLWQDFKAETEDAGGKI
jgi:hypothetical protein